MSHYFAQLAFRLLGCVSHDVSIGESARFEWTLIGAPLSATRLTTSIRLFTLILFLFSVAKVIAAQTSRFEFEQSSKGVYDAARLVSSGDFATPKLLERFKQFGVTECAQRQLARLTVVTNERDLENVVNVRLPAIPRARIPIMLAADPTLLGSNLGQLNSAEVICFDGSVTAFVRRDGKVSQYRLSGENDVRDLNLRALRLTFVGFKLERERPDVAKHDPNPLPDMVWIYAKTDALPTLGAAAAARSQLESQIKTRTYLILRTAPFFFDYGGPRSDLFEVQHSTASTREFLVRPYIECWPNGTGGSCRLVKSPTETR